MITKIINQVLPYVVQVLTEYLITDHGKIPVVSLTGGQTHLIYNGIKEINYLH